MKKILSCLLVLSVLLMTGCQGAANQESGGEDAKPLGVAAPVEGAVNIALSDDGITVDGQAISDDAGAAVYAARDIVFYPEGMDFTFGEGTQADAHPQSEADGHTVIHITQPGTYALSGSLSAGQVAVDLGKDAKEDPDAVVTLILNGVKIACSVAPAIIFYNVYECGPADADTATKEVDTTDAGANVIVADGTVNHVQGSYVARIYKPDSVEFSEDGTKVLEAKKLHKYDAAFYSKMSLNVGGGEKGSGSLAIVAENEGLDSELHLTINGGIITIQSGNDGINTNEDGVSVTTINGGVLDIRVTGSTGEGDGIDSNGWLVINGGTVMAAACSFSADAGIDSDMGIHINGGTVVATGNMLDSIGESAQEYVIFRLPGGWDGEKAVVIKNEAGEELLSHNQANDYSSLIFSSPDMAGGTYTLWNEETLLASRSSGEMQGMGFPGGFGGGKLPDGGMEFPEGMTPPAGMEWPEGNMGGNFVPNEDGTVTLPDGSKMDPSQFMSPEGGRGPMGMEPPAGMEMPQGNGEQTGRPAR